MASFDKADTEIVAAIDFGTTYSAYAYAHSPQDKSKLTSHDVKVNKDWGSEIGAQLPKTPTTVLVKDDGKFVSFGHVAEKEYYSLCQDEPESNAARYHLIKNFKMMLYHEKELSHSTKVSSLSGKQFKAINIFAMALKYLRDHLLKDISQQYDRQFEESIIKWVITIPAIWNDSAKQFMREAACEAGLISTKDSKQLVFALEPEAASVICRSLEVNHFKGIPEETMQLTFPHGTKYLIIDAGGGTVDITSHEILCDQNIKEITYASGGNWGGSEVNKKFEKLLEEILGSAFITEYKKQCTLQWLDIINRFEHQKRDVNTGSSALKIQLPCDMEDDMKCDLKEMIQEKSSLGVKFDNGELVLNKEAISKMFNIDNIISHVREKMKDPNLKDMKYILLVGGYGGSEILFQKLKLEFSETTTVITPHFAELTIVKGAVLFGINPSVITARVARKTYGFGINDDFIQGVHEEHRRFEDDDGRILCRGGFKTMVEKNETVELDSIRTFNVKPTYRSQTRVKFDFYATEKREVMYEDEEGVKKVGELTVKNIPIAPKDKTDDKRNIKVKVLFGHPEILIELEDQTKNSYEQSTLNLLLDFLFE